ncbi:MAG: helix-turn-helix domain-containing protein [Firmicutes bacterium]|nr:helix-turn-helix domain-containing protein [Bacillota bacterium]
MNEIEIGGKIAQGRKEKGLSQSQFAEMLNISPQAVSKWERGESLPDIIMLGKIANVIGMDLNHFASLAKEEKQGKVKNMSYSGWKDADFSGLKNLHEKMSCSNIQRCKFVGADLSGITFRANNMKDNDFTDALISGGKFSMANLTGNNFKGTDLSEIMVTKSNFGRNDFHNANFRNAKIKVSKFEENDMIGAILDGIEFDKSVVKRIIFSGSMENCSFVHNVFKKVEFADVIFRNLFFKGSAKGITFTNCMADKASYAFLQASGANMTGIEILA